MTQALNTLHETPLFKGLFALAALVALHAWETPSSGRVEAGRDLSVHIQQPQLTARHADWAQPQAVDVARMPSVEGFDRGQVRNAAEPSHRDDQQVWSELPRQQRWVF